MQMYYLFLRDLLLPVCARANSSVEDKNGQLIAKSDAKIIQQSAISCRMLKKSAKYWHTSQNRCTFVCQIMISHANRVT